MHVRITRALMHVTKLVYTKNKPSHRSVTATTQVEDRPAPTAISVSKDNLKSPWCKQGFKVPWYNNRGSMYIGLRLAAADSVRVAGLDAFLAYVCIRACRRQDGRLHSNSDRCRHRGISHSLASCQQWTPDAASGTGDTEGNFLPRSLVFVPLPCT